MDPVKFRELLKGQISGKLETILKPGDEDAEERFFSGCYDIFVWTVFKGDVRPEPGSEEMRICQVLTNEGYLKQGGNTTVYFERTDKARDLISDSIN